jgi:hypothetical protein
MICKVSLSISGMPADSETSVTCQLTCDGEEGAVQVSSAQLRGLQEACLAVACAEAGLAPDRPADQEQRAAKATPTLCQLARLYRTATKVAFFDLPQLEGLSRRLYQKPLAELSMIEVGGLTGTLNAVVKGMVDAKHVRSETAPACNGQVGKPVA